MTQVSANKPERPPKTRDEREPSMGGVEPWEHGRLFSQLFIGEGDDSGFGSTLPTTQSVHDRLMIEALTEQLAPRLNGATQWPLQATFLLPRMGRIKVSASRESNAWSLGLDAEEERTRLWLSNVRQRCEDRLAGELGAPVCLHLSVQGTL